MGKTRVHIERAKAVGMAVFGQVDDEVLLTAGRPPELDRGNGVTKPTKRRVENSAKLVPTGWRQPGAAGAANSGD